MGLVVAASVIAFFTTEIDNLVALIVLFCAAGTRTDRTAAIFGSYAGLFLLVASSQLFSEALTGVRVREILGLLGFVIMLLGIHICFSERKGMVRVVFWFLTALIMTAADGGDNIAVYIPFFSSLSGREFFILCIVFAVMQAAICKGSLMIVNAKSIKDYIRETYSVLVPILFILLGFYVLLASGTFMWMFGK